MASPITVARHEAFFQVIFVRPGEGCIFRNGSDTGHTITVWPGAMSMSDERDLLIEICHATVDQLRGARAI